MATGKQINQLKTIRLKGYRPFRDFMAQLDQVEVFVGANGSGKTALFEFLRILRDAMTQDIPPGVLPDSVGQQVFHLAGPEQVSWDLEFIMDDNRRIDYRGKLFGPLGQIRIAEETVSAGSKGDLTGRTNEGTIHIRDPRT